MKEFVGVKSALNYHYDFLKREALIFDRIAVPLFESLFNQPSSSNLFDEDAVKELEPLFDSGVLFDPGVPKDQKLLTNDDYRESFYRMFKVADEAAELTREDRENREEIDRAISEREWIAQDILRFERTIKAIEMHIVSSDYHSRAVSIQLRELHHVDAIPILASRIDSAGISNVNRNNVVNIVLQHIPTPSDSVSWEEILEYRSDPDTKSMFLGLRHWMSEVARAGLTPIEVEEKLAYLIDRYQRHIKLHKLKTETTVFETVVVASAEFLENLAKFQWGKIAKGLFSFRQGQIALIEGELTAPGNEIAYIAKAREKF